MIQVIGKGNANCVVIIPPDMDNVYRFNITTMSLRKSNRYTEENFTFIKNIMIPLLQQFIPTMELVTVDAKILRSILRPYITCWDARSVVSIKMPNFVSPAATKLNIDHRTNIHSHGNSRLTWEFKPKWLYQNTDYCRNCTIEVLRNRPLPYCYAQLTNPSKAEEILKVIFRNISVPSEFITSMIHYFQSHDNILHFLYRRQREIDTNLKPILKLTDITQKHCISMSLKDLTCFVDWCPQTGIKAHIVDVDKKCSSKWNHWIRTLDQLEASKIKIFH